MSNTVHHRVIVDTTPELTNLLERLADRAGIEKDLKFIKKELQKIMATNAELEAAVQDVVASVTTGFQNIDVAVTAAADRVIATINSGGDPAAQIAELQALKNSVTASTQAEVDKVNAIDPTTPTNPVP